MSLNVFGTLMSKVINANLCTNCGTCIGSCPVNVLYSSDAEKPTIKGRCILCQICYYSCPRVSLDIQEIEKGVFGRARNDGREMLTGIYKSAYLAKTTDPYIQSVCQDGGVATSLLKFTLENNTIDCAVATSSDAISQLKPKPTVIWNPKELLLASGARYSIGGSVGGLGEAFQSFPKGNFAFVGLPCEIQGFRKIQFSKRSNEHTSQNVALSIGIFCSKVFNYNQLIDYFSKECGDGLKDITRVEIKKGRLKALSRNKDVLVDVPVNKADQFVREGCRTCPDYTAELSDISIGAAGAPLGWSIVLTRTEAGENAFKEVCKSELLEYKPIADLKKELGLVLKLAEIKKKNIWKQVE
ncbi:MAG: Coenzyme F420 hydrogenase/dehydrogenase, beta subunit C-terminal domain [Candidatus Bathyarchaeota archaeon]|nr:Coenzyme F420 hydrogenase/dehydrogenase, beta subunit C-terminal domain [Candidatus Bathyarchaeota archaeon]MCZ2845485.1 Coenzyme F420 hydrogenase/dehydrogenase, beta subunit C-terminal domain [Candidatus Bathyarchaeota archaeon]